MTGIGVVMFGKGLLVGLWVTAAFAWDNYRKKRMASGLPMREGRDGVYRVFDWTLWVNAVCRWTKYATFALMYSWWAFLLLGYFVMGREWTSDAVIWLLF